MIPKSHVKSHQSSVIVYLFNIVLVLSLSNCSNENKTLSIPKNYDATNFTTSAATELSILNQLDVLVSEMKKGRSIENVLLKNVLQNLYEEGSPSLADITTSYYDSKIIGETGFFAELEKASGNAYHPSTPNETGGVYGAYLFNPYGLEIEQQVEKGIFSSACYNHFLNLSKSGITSETVHQMLAITGANSSFPSSNNSAKHENPDRFAAVYMARRDKNDGNGFYSTLKKELIRLQAAVNEGSDFNDERDEAIENIKQAWEKAIMATVINYSYAAVATLSSTNPTEAQKASALHAYGEAVGFLHGWKTIPQTDKIITDSQIDGLLTVLNASTNSSAASYLFVTDPTNQLPKLLQVISQIKDIYDFSSDDLEAFKKNWVSEQSR
ncbi:MAG: hypothetical protein GW823_10365 [Bacteroidetes bacterium]|nr:hypothetical protein [Bacteroidota bacterium]